mgnify:CR=1 FL=1
MTTEPKTTPELTADFIRRVVTYTDEITYFGGNGVGAALAEATSAQTAMSEQQYRGLIRRHTLIGSSGDFLTDVMEENGVPRLGPQRSLVLVIVRPWSTRVTDINAGQVEVLDSSKFEVGDSIRITSSDGGTSEIVEIQAITTGTGPNGLDELDVGLVVQTYTPDPDDDDVLVLLRRTLVAGTQFDSDAGIAFQSLDDLTVGDSNPVMAGESVSLALADKVWAEAITPGKAGDVTALTITSLSTPDPDIRAILNPSRAFGGDDAESDFSGKYRAAHQPQMGAIETHAFLEALARRGNTDVLRAVPEDSDAISTIRIRVLTRSGGGLSADARAALELYMSQRTRSQLAVEVLNLVPTAIEVYADVTLTPGPGNALKRLTAAWRRAADKLADYLDYRKWPEGREVDEAALLTIVLQTRGIATLTTSTFEPAADTPVAAASIPLLARFVLRDTASGQTFGANLTPTF